MDLERICQNLRLVPLLNTLEDEALRALAAECREVSFAPEEALFLQGQPGEEMFLIIEGSVRIGLETINGREVTVALRREGSFIGEMALLDGDPRSASGYAMCEVRCLALRKSSVQKLLQQNNAASLTLILALCRRLRQSSIRLEEVAVRTIRQRLAATMARLAKAEGEPDGDGILLKPIVNYRMLTGLMCANRESVSRAASELIDDGLLERRGRRFRIVDLDALEEAAWDQKSHN